MRVYGAGAVTAVLFLLGLPPGSHAQSIADIVASGSRSSNGMVLSIILGSDTTDAVAAAQALGRRTDPYVGDILSALFARTTGRETYRYTLLLRIVLEYNFLLPSPSPARIAANLKSLASLLGNIQSVSDAATKGALLEISRFLPRTAVEKPLLDEGRFLVGYLGRTDGRFAADRLEEALAFLRACRAHDNEVLRGEVVTLVELARDAAFVKRARAYLGE